jgi:hypothetical protein
MKGRSPITAVLMTAVLTALMSGCGSSEPVADATDVADDQHAAAPREPGHIRRGLDAVGDTRALTETINARSQSQ